MEHAADSQPPLPRLSRRALHLLPALLIPLLLSSPAAYACWWAAGASLGFFFGGIAFAALLAPALVAGESTQPARLLAIAGLLHGLALPWLAVVFTTDTTFTQWLACYILLAAFLLALTGLTLALQRIRFSAVAAAAMTTTLAVAWLAWPIWLAAALHGSAAQHFVNVAVPVHPLFAANAAVSNLGLWTEQSLIYRLSSMNQDVTVNLPEAIWGCVILHAVIGIVLGVCGIVRRTNRK